MTVKTSYDMKKQLLSIICLLIIKIDDFRVKN